MAAAAEVENEKYVISRIDYDEEVGYYPTSYIRVSGRNFDCAIHIEGTLSKAIQLAKDNLSCQVRELGVFSRDRENGGWKIVIVNSQN